VAITSGSIESANIALTALDLLGDSAIGISKELASKTGWIDRRWRTSDENAVRGHFVDDDRGKLKVAKNSDFDCMKEVNAHHRQTIRLTARAILQTNLTMEVL
jgi:hypothetical protein